MDATDYENTQNFNFITKYLHSTRYKALLSFFEEINQAIQHRPIRVVDIGCGVGKAFSLLNSRYSIDYVGIDTDENFYFAANQRYGHHENFKIFNESIENHFSLLNEADVVISLESMEHIPETIVGPLIERVAASGVNYFYCSVPNEIGLAILVKNIGSLLMGYHRHKEYTWLQTWRAACYNLHKIPRHSTSHIGFDWRWLAHIIRRDLNLRKIKTSPIQIMPRFLSPSIIFICTHDSKNLR